MTDFRLKNYLLLGLTGIIWGYIWYDHCKRMKRLASREHTAKKETSYYPPAEEPYNKIIEKEEKQNLNLEKLVKEMERLTKRVYSLEKDNQDLKVKVAVLQVQTESSEKRTSELRDDLWQERTHSNAARWNIVENVAILWQQHNRLVNDVKNKTQTTAVSQNVPPPQNIPADSQTIPQ